jgi:hypothetical protein
MTVTTISHVRRDLAAAGFAEDLQAEGGQLRERSTGTIHDPSDLVVTRLVRFGGITVPQEEALLFALSSSDGRPVGTYAPSCDPAISPADAEVVELLHERTISEEEIKAHKGHEHVAAVFDERSDAEEAVEELGRLGLGSDRLGLAIREGAQRAFEGDAEHELLHDTGVGVATGAAIGFLAGSTIAAIALVPGGVVGLGGILALGAATGFGGGMLGGYVGEAVGDRAYGEREELAAVPLEPGQVLVAVCGHGHVSTVEAIMRRHAGQLLLRPLAV